MNAIKSINIIRYKMFYYNLFNKDGTRVLTGCHKGHILDVR